MSQSLDYYLSKKRENKQEIKTNNDDIINQIIQKKLNNDIRLPINKHVLAAFCHKLNEVMSENNLIHKKNPVDAFIDVLNKGICPFYYVISDNKFLYYFKPISSKECILYKIEKEEEKKYIPKAYRNTIAEQVNKYKIISSEKYKPIEKKRSNKKHNKKKDPNSSNEDEDSSEGSKIDDSDYSDDMSSNSKEDDSSNSNYDSYSDNNSSEVSENSEDLSSK